jgi:hypothetical protein
MARPRLLERSAEVFSCLVELIEDRPDVEMSIMVEHFTIAKINSMPGDATVYQCVPHPNAVNIIRWKENTPENVKWV